ncbi:hypothetical protein BPAE_0358g00030 [Botrytis paeoniae]|uniref:Uncharacterized protein n=1 Tax=Botrytis paeoniae TaxID=278948 RepID=A0A4Z1F2V2_9HELO|nr:hypothetical protein BPAE_0358g00030 [Botrytis paeoniae]
MTSLRVLKPNTLYIIFQTRKSRETRETRDAPILALEDDNTKVSAYISGSKDPWVGRWGTINQKLSTNRTVRFRDVNLRHRSQSFFLWEIMPTNNNNRVLNRLQQMYISNKHGNWTASKASLRLLQILHGGHRKINLLFQPIIPAHASGVFRTIQEAERKLPVQDRGLPSNLTILRVQPDYPLSNKTTNLAMYEPRVGEYMEPSIPAQQDHSRRSSVPRISSAAPPIYPTVGALPHGGYVMPPINAPQVLALPQYPQVVPTMANGQPLPPQTAEPIPVSISSSTSGRRRSISSQPSNTYYRKESNFQNSHNPSTDSDNSNPRRRRNSESEARYHGKRNIEEENSSSNHGRHLGVRETLSHFKDKLMHPVPPTPSGRSVA